MDAAEVGLAGIDLVVVCYRARGHTLLLTFDPASWREVAAYLSDLGNDPAGPWTWDDLRRVGRACDAACRGREGYET